MTVSPELKQRGLLLLASGKSQKAIAEELGISEKTVSRWKKDPDYVAYSKEATLQACDAGIAKFASLFNTAAEKLEDILNDPNAPQRLQMEAAKMIINYALESRRREFEEIKAIEILMAAGFLPNNAVIESSEAMKELEQRMKNAIAKGRN